MDKKIEINILIRELLSSKCEIKMSLIPETYILYYHYKSHFPITGFLPVQDAKKAGNGDGKKYPVRLANV